MSPTKRTACQTCRVRHLPCDGELPTCGECRSQKRRCTPRFNVRFSSHRAWAPNAGKKLRIRGDDNHNNATTPPPNNDDESLLGASEAPPPCEVIPSPYEESVLDPGIEPQPPTVTVSPGQLSCSSLSSVAPDLSHREAILFQYFAELSGPWLDLSDPYFSVEVLHLAPTCPVLRWSVLALSSFYHSRQEAGGNEEAEFFHDKAVATLLSLMPDRTLLTDGAVLASAVILRLYEESKARQYGQDAENHFLGAHIFATMAHEKQERDTKLSYAAWWMHQRQDVYRAVFHQSPTRTEVDISRLGDSADLTDVHDWVKRAQALAGQVADFCFGPGGQPVDVHNDLKYKLQEWSERCPSVFTPLYFAEREPSAGHPFPEIRFALNSALTGYIHYQLAQLLMTMYNPNGPKLGPEAIRWHKQVELDVQNYVRILCGTAYFNTCPVGRAIACLAIRLCSGCFHDAAEQLQLLSLLELTERENGWSHHLLQQNLRVSWGLEG